MLIRVAALAIVVAMCCRVATGQPQTTPGPPHPQIDAQAFFEELVDRYRELAVYEDVVDVTEVVTRSGRTPHRLETRIVCRLDGEKLRVTTPGSQVRQGAGADLPLAASPALTKLILRYNLWQAPHLALRFLEDPLKDFRVGVPEGFAATAAVVRDDGEMVQLTLIAQAEPDPGEDPARFDLWVDPASMLVRRLAGRQRLPDGSSFQTTLVINPVLASERPMPPPPRERDPSLPRRSTG